MQRMGVFFLVLAVTNFSSFSVLQGFSKAMSGFVKLGLINAEPSPDLKQTSAHISWVRSSAEERSTGPLSSQFHQFYGDPFKRCRSSETVTDVLH